VRRAGAPEHVFGEIDMPRNRRGGRSFCHTRPKNHAITVSSARRLSTPRELPHKIQLNRPRQERKWQPEMDALSPLCCADAPPMRRTSPVTALAKLDQRTREARLVRSVRAQLTAHVGGKPSATQAALIEQAAQLALRIATMDRDFAKSGGLTEHDSKAYLAWANAYGRLMRHLGLKGAAERGPSLAEHLAAHASPPRNVGP
jgi:hypothetical protein